MIDVILDISSVICHIRLTMVLACLTFHRMSGYLESTSLLACSLTLDIVDRLSSKFLDRRPKFSSYYSVTIDVVTNTVVLLIVNQYNPHWPPLFLYWLATTFYAIYSSIGLPNKSLYFNQKRWTIFGHVMWYGPHYTWLVFIYITSWANISINTSIIIWIGYVMVGIVTLDYLKKWIYRYDVCKYKKIC